MYQIEKCNTYYIFLFDTFFITSYRIKQFKIIDHNDKSLQDFTVYY